MENGGIVEEGSHDGLLAKGGHYATLYNTYFRHQSLPFRCQDAHPAEYVEQAREMAAVGGPSRSSEPF